MDKFVSLSRAAKLVGVSRGALQRKVHDGELISFEGMIAIDELSEVYPDTEFDDHQEIERMERIIQDALIRARYKKFEKLISPDVSTLAMRANSLNKELIRTKSLLEQYQNIFNQLQQQLKQETLNPEQLRLLFSEGLTQLGDADLKTHPLISKDTFLRMTSAHVRVLPTEHDYFLEGAESLLDAGIRSGLNLNYGCSNGNCGKCKARLISGDVKQIHHFDYPLSEAEREQGYLLMCCHTAINDITLSAEEALAEQDIPHQEIQAKIKKLETLEPGTLILHIRMPRTQRLRFMAGQQVQLRLQDGNKEACYIASCPCDELNLQFHFPLSSSPSPLLTQLLNSKVQDSITIEGPYGNFILHEESTRPMLFLAFDYGFAPIKGLIENAQAMEMAESMELIRFSSQGEAYMHNLCRAWNDALDGFVYRPVTVDAGWSVLDSLEGDLSAYQIYVAGSAEMVDRAQTQLLERGAEPDYLYRAVV